MVGVVVDESIPVLLQPLQPSRLRGKAHAPELKLPDFSICCANECANSLGLDVTGTKSMGFLGPVTILNGLMPVGERSHSTNTKEELLTILIWIPQRMQHKKLLGQRHEYTSQAVKEKERSMTFSSLEAIRSGIYSEVGYFDSLSVD